jgi:hypothetical protein
MAPHLPRSGGTRAACQSERQGKQQHRLPIDPSHGRERAPLDLDQSKITNF